MPKNDDVPSPVNFQLFGDAQVWESTAMDRPYRLDMFEGISECIRDDGKSNVLELGSGPGFLAEFLCSRIPNLELTLLDFSNAMHKLAMRRLNHHLKRVRFVERDFKKIDWTNDLGTFDSVVTNQAVHELRHKRYAPNFHIQVRSLLASGGRYLVCDHFFGEGGLQNDQLFMTVDEQLSALESAGFEATVVLKKGSLVLIQAK